MYRTPPNPPKVLYQLFGGAPGMKKTYIQREASMEPVISESELALIRFNYESAWKKCVNLIQEGKLLVVEDTRQFEFLREDSGKNASIDSFIS